MSDTPAGTTGKAQIKLPQLPPAVEPEDLRTRLMEVAVATPSGERAKMIDALSRKMAGGSNAVEHLLEVIEDTSAAREEIVGAIAILISPAIWDKYTNPDLRGAVVSWLVWLATQEFDSDISLTALAAAQALLAEGPLRKEHANTVKTCILQARQMDPPLTWSIAVSFVFDFVASNGGESKDKQ
jgi:hypothetical protein